VLQILNDSGLLASLFVSPDPDGVETVYTVVKGTFLLNDRLALAPQQVPITMADVHAGDPATSSVSIPSDVSLAKPGTDVLLLGSAWAPDGRPTWQMDVTVSVASLKKSVRVFGDRVWQSDSFGGSFTWVTPFLQMPLTWERAFGGLDQTSSGPHAHARNPAGRGYRLRESERPIVGMPLPNLEDPLAPIAAWNDAPPPACFAPVAAHWEPRSLLAGTYDEQWQRTRAPYLPLDFDARFFQLAPPDLVAHGYLQGGEIVEVRGASPTGMLQFRLPSAKVSVRYNVDGSEVDRSAPLDTVIVEPDAGRLTLVWRSALACDKRVLRVREVAIIVAGLN
jgi:hypothetical protein